MLALENWVDTNVAKERVMLTLGYQVDHTPSARISSLVNEYAENAFNLVDPVYTYVIRDIEWIQDSVAFIENSIIFKSRVIARLLERCEKVGVFALTIGNHLEEMICRLAGDGLVLQASVLDAIGSVVTEKVADIVQGKISKIAGANGLCTSQRFSPGYCDWHIGQQRMLFWALGGSNVGIRLTGRCLMIPQKSISGIIGLGTYDSNVENYNPCGTCKKSNCPGRRV